MGMAEVISNHLVGGASKMGAAQAKEFVRIGIEKTDKLKTLSKDEQAKWFVQRDIDNIRNYHEKNRVANKKRKLYTSSLLTDWDILGLTFDSFNPRPESMAHVNRAKKWAKVLAQGEHHGRFVMFGTAGTGKSWLSASIANYVNTYSNAYKRQQVVLYLSSTRIGDLAKLVKSNSYGKEAESARKQWRAVMDAVKGRQIKQFDPSVGHDISFRQDFANLIVIDDLGRENKSGSNAEHFKSLMFDLLDAIHKDASIIVNSNYTMAELSSMYDNDGALTSRMFTTKQEQILDFRSLPMFRATEN